MTSIKSINPSTNEVLGEVKVTGNKDIKAKVAAAYKAKRMWKDLGPAGRAKELKKLYQVLAAHQPELAKAASLEMGMPINDSKADVADGLHFFQWYLDNAENILQPEITYQDKQAIHTVYREPYGVAAVIVPWNFPISNCIWQAIPNLIAGNTVVYKGSEEVILFGQLLEKLALEADLPTGVFNVIHGDGKTGDFLVHQDINLISFTGSSKVGAQLYRVAAEKFIKAVLELGGSAPGIIMADADVDAVLDTVFANRFLYGGQVCDGLKRLLIAESRFDEVVSKLKTLAESKRVGPALDPQTELGPLVAERQVKLLEDQVADALDKGAKLITGGRRPDHLAGSFYQPTLLTNIKPTMRVWQEEVFGPVLPIVSFSTQEEAVKLANDTTYGLGSYVFTQNKNTAATIAAQLETGMVMVNNASYIKPQSPFGGYKRSGMGREHGHFGLEDLTQIKVVAQEK